MSTETPERWRRLRAVAAFVMIALIVVFVATSVIVGEFALAPRDAALIAFALAALFGVAGASYGPTRRFFAGLLTGISRK